MENLAIFGGDAGPEGAGMMEDAMWSIFDQPSSLERDWCSGLLFPDNISDENVNLFGSDDELNDPALSVAASTKRASEEEPQILGCELLERPTEPKKRGVATMSIVRPPLGWKPPVHHVKEETRQLKTSCCVLHCNNSPQRCGPRIKFHSFPGRAYETERKEMWIKAINRVNPDGTPWRPTKYSKVCSEHFVGGIVSNIASHPAYIPSIFPPAPEETPKSFRKPVGFQKTLKQNINSKRRVLQGSSNALECDSGPTRYLHDNEFEF